MTRFNSQDTLVTSDAELELSTRYPGNGPKITPGTSPDHDNTDNHSIPGTGPEDKVPPKTTVNKRITSRAGAAPSLSIVQVKIPNKGKGRTPRKNPCSLW